MRTVKRSLQPPRPRRKVTPDGLRGPPISRHRARVDLLDAAGDSPTVGLVDLDAINERLARPAPSWRWAHLPVLWPQVFNVSM